MKLKMKTRQLPFNKLETMYYILEQDEDEELYDIIYNFSKGNNIILLKDIKIEHKEDYDNIYYRIVKNIKNTSPVNNTTKDCIYIQRIGRRWYIKNTFM